MNRLVMTKEGAYKNDNTDSKSNQKNNQKTEIITPKKTMRKFKHYQFRNRKAKDAELQMQLKKKRTLKQQGNHKQENYFL